LFIVFVAAVIPLFTEFATFSKAFTVATTAPDAAFDTAAMAPEAAEFTAFIADGKSPAWPAAPLFAEEFSILL
jgi:hypothetical protein